MIHKSNQNYLDPQPLFAGLDKTSESIEFFGNPETKTVQFIQQGEIHSWKELSPKYFAVLLNAFNKDSYAREVLSTITDSYGNIIKPSVTRKVELYTYYCYGALDSLPDIIDGALQPAENFRHERDCLSLNFKTKDITINNIPLKPREIKMLDLFSQDYKDEVVAQELGIVPATLNQHKKQLFNKANVFSKPALLLKAAFEQILTPSGWA